MHVRIIEPNVKTVKKRRACAYARVSTDSEKQSESIENQITYYENLIANNEEFDFKGVFADRGITGTTDNRPQFKEMLELCRQGKIDVIYTKSISRFARNTMIMLEVVRKLKLLGVEVIFEKENIKTLSGDGELMLTVLSSFAQEESKNVSDNIKWRIRKKFESGELLVNTNRFLGYDKDEYGDLIINEDEATVVIRIFQEYLKGKGVFKIAKELNRDNIPTVTGARWHQSTILAILKNEKYKGDAILQKTYIQDHLTKKRFRNTGQIDSFYIEENHSPIVTKEVWEWVQVEMQKRAESKGIFKGSDKYQNRYPLSGMLYCSKCGATLKRRTWNSKHSCRKIVWQCSNYIKNGKDACSGTKIDDEVVSRLNIKEETIVKEVIKDGKKHYHYSSKSKQNESCREYRTSKKKNGCILPSVDRPIRTVIKL